MADRTVGCAFHCSSCGAHFSSESAFDTHRVGRFSPNERRCVEPADATDRKGRAKFEPRSTSAVCRLGREPRVGVTVWTLAGAADRWASRAA